MSRVTMYDIWVEEINSEKFNRCSGVEVVPRKMVEMIIKKCEETIQKQEHTLNFYVPDSYICSNATAVRISTMQLKEYAESLLDQFEEFEEDK